MTSMQHPTCQGPARLGPAQLGPVLADLFVYWRSRCRDGLLPARADIDPIALRGILPSIFLLDVLGPRRFRTRLAGTEIVAQNGFNPTGQIMDDALMQGPHRQTLDMYDFAASRQLPVQYHANPFFSDEKPWLAYRSLVLPLAGADSQTGSLIGALHHEERELSAAMGEAAEPGAIRGHMPQWQPLPVT